MELKDRIQMQRKNKKMSQEELAQRLDISRQSVSKWESGISQPDLSNLVRLSEIFEVSTDYLLTGKEPESASQKKIILNPRNALILGTVLNLMGVILSLIFWKEFQDWKSYAFGLCLPLIGTGIFLLGFNLNHNSPDQTEVCMKFWKLNIWIVSLVPFSLIWTWIVTLLSGGSPWATPWPNTLSLLFRAFYWPAWLMICLALLRKMENKPDQFQKF